MRINSIQHTTMARKSRVLLSMGWVDPRVGLGWVELGWVGLRFFLAFWWVGLGRGPKTFPKF